MNIEIGLYALQYSTKQKCFDIDSFNNVISSNIALMGNEDQSDYKIICVGTEDDCYELMHKIINKNPNLLNIAIRSISL